MSRMHQCVVCMGSNDCPSESLLWARKELLALFPSIRFASEQQTAPLHFKTPALFHNQVAVFVTEMGKVEVNQQLKTIEQLVGRRPEETTQERVRLDIDLLSFDAQELKVEDLQRDYVVKGLKELKEKSK